MTDGSAERTSQSVTSAKKSVWVPRSVVDRTLAKIRALVSSAT